MEKIGCCLQEALDREASMADQVEQLEQHLLTKRFHYTAFDNINDVHLTITVLPVNLSDFPPCCSNHHHHSPVWGRGTLPLSPFPLVHLLRHLLFFLLFPFFHWLYLFSSFVHPFPFYQNSPTLFPGRRS